MARADAGSSHRGLVAVVVSSATSGGSNRAVVSGKGSDLGRDTAVVIVRAHEAGGCPKVCSSHGVVVILIWSRVNAIAIDAVAEEAWWSELGRPFRKQAMEFGSCL
jgi:hypothetical protein